VFCGWILRLVGSIRLIREFISYNPLLRGVVSDKLKFGPSPEAVKKSIKMDLKK